MDFAEFLEILEDKVGNLNTSQGLQKVFNFISSNPEKDVATIDDLRRIKTELGLTLDDKDLQSVINFITASFNANSKFTFSQLEGYVLKNRTKN